jgi:putative nucleotidyltransferase with HDIG domain
MFDVFSSGGHPDTVVRLSLESSRKIVSEILKAPLGVQSLSTLTSASKGVANHSVNVSVLSVYLALQMGYSHQGILGHLALGGILHDIGKIKVPISESDSPEEVQAKMKEHPTYGVRLLETRERDVPEEVRKIVAQHHENQDGTGYPKKLRGSAIYDLTKIVAIANAFDELVGEGKGTLIQRQRNAVQTMDQILYHKFDPEKIDKAMKILKLGV